MLLGMHVVETHEFTSTFVAMQISSILSRCLLNRFILEKFSQSSKIVDMRPFDDKRRSENDFFISSCHRHINDAKSLWRCGDMSWKMQKLRSCMWNSEWPFDVTKTRKTMSYNFIVMEQSSSVVKFVSVGEFS